MQTTCVFNREPLMKKESLAQIFPKGPKRVAHDLILDYILVMIKKEEKHETSRIHKAN